MQDEILLWHTTSTILTMGSVVQCVILIVCDTNIYRSLKIFSQKYFVFKKVRIQNISWLMLTRENF